MGFVLHSPTPLMDCGVIISYLILTVAMICTLTGQSSYTYMLSGTSFLCNIVTAGLVFRRVKANLIEDKLSGGFPVYNMSFSMYRVTLLTIAGIFPSLCICLFTWLTSAFCWWVAATAWVVNLYVLYETLNGGQARLREAEKNIKDGYMWHNNAWKEPEKKNK